MTTARFWICPNCDASITTSVHFCTTGIPDRLKHKTLRVSDDFAALVPANFKTPVPQPRPEEKKKATR